MEQLLFWWSIISTIIGLLFLGWGVWQLSSNRKEREIHRSEVKLWQRHASGLAHGIKSLTEEEFSSIKDIQQAAKICEANANSLYASLNEEKIFNEKEAKEKELRDGEAKEKQLKDEATKEKELKDEAALKKAQATTENDTEKPAEPKK